MNPSVESLNADERGLILSCPQCGQRNRAGYERLDRVFRCGQCQHELRPGSEPVEIQDEQVFAALVGRSALPVLVDFWASWCGPCKMVAPELVKVAAEGAGRWIIAKVSTEELPMRAQRLGVRAIPTLALFQGGREIARQAGAMSASGIIRFLSQSSLR